MKSHSNNVHNYSCDEWGCTDLQMNEQTCGKHKAILGPAECVLCVWPFMYAWRGNSLVPRLSPRTTTTNS